MCFLPQEFISEVIIDQNVERVPDKVRRDGGPKIKIFRCHGATEQVIKNQCFLPSEPVNTNRSKSGPRAGKGREALDHQIF